MEQRSEQYRIIESACKLFREKGFEAVCLDDIANDSGIQGWDIEMYFQSKENIFDIIITKQTNSIFDKIKGILNDENTSLHQKVQQLILCYFFFMKENEHLNLFILSRIKIELSLPTGEKYNKLLLESIFAKQVKLHLDMFYPSHHISIPNLFLDLTSLCVFPLLIIPSIIENEKQNYFISFERLFTERKELIYSWFKTLLMM
jgi:hypothetical protein